MMKKTILVATCSLFTISMSAQVGINTSNPLGTLHIDGAKDNAATPTAAQTANDFVVKSSGNVGLGTTNPETKLHVISNTSNAFRYNLIDAPSATGNGFTLALRNTSPLATGNIAMLGFTNNGPTVGGGSWGIGTIRTGGTSITGSEEDFFMGNSTGGNLNERMRIQATTGNVGLGISSPTAKLHINSSTSPAFRLVDGTQGAGRVLKSDANGNASWIQDNTALPTIIATLGTGATISATTVDPALNGTDTGTRITLPANSKYIIMCYMLVRASKTVPSNGYAWLQSTFTESATSNTHSSDIQGSFYISGAIIPNQNYFNMMNGAIVIQNSTSSPKTYYYRVRLAYSSGLTAGTEVSSFGGNAWGENNIIAVGIN